MGKSLLIATVLLCTLIAGCSAPPPLPPTPTPLPPPPPPTTEPVSNLVLMLTSGTGFWLQPDYSPPVSGVGVVRTHAVYYFSRDGTGRRQILLMRDGTIQPGGLTAPTSFRWSVDEQVITMANTITQRVERVGLFPQSENDLAVIMDSPLLGVNGRGVWLRCASEGCL